MNYADSAARHRWLYGILLVVTILLGLASRQFGDALPRVVALYAGDVLWAAMVYWLGAVAFPQAAVIRIAVVGAAIALAVELSQLYHAAWIDAIRATRTGGLILGRGFLWTDLLCYGVGVILAGALDRWVIGRSPVA